MPSVPVSGMWLRHTPAGADPLARPPLPADGRWQHGAAIEGIYLAATESTVWAEWYRWLAEHEIEPLRALPRELWRFRATLRHVADLTSTDALNAVELPSAAPSREQWPAFQTVGEQLHGSGFEGILYRSAAHRDGICLCVFRTSPRTDALKPVPPPRRFEQPPRPPRGMRT